MTGSGHSYQRSEASLPRLAEGDETDDLDDDKNEDAAAARSTSTSTIGSDDRAYDWRLYIPVRKTWGALCRWMIVGGAAKANLTEAQVQKNIHSLARCLVLLREYADHFGLPPKGGPQDQEFVLREVFRDLYLGGAPIWALESVMQKASEGLTGDPAINWLLLPRKAFMSGKSLGGTHMFKCERGFSIQKMDYMEKVATRLASFASNTRGFGNVPARLPLHEELLKASRTASSRSLFHPPAAAPPDAAKKAKEILSLASRAEGLFFFVNQKRDENIANANGDESIRPMADAFWTISEREQEIFARLACIEAMEAIDRLDGRTADAYPAWLVVVFRIVASAGATGFWFGGSWHDMWIAGVLAVFVAMIGSFEFLSRTERVIFETVASFMVGLSTGLVALQFPNDTCYTAMALGGILDILQGFRVVYAVIEIMSKNTLCGGANLLEGVLFTGLIAYFLQFGQYCAAQIMEKEVGSTFSSCTHGIDQCWYFLFVPAAAISWSALFTPKYENVPIMAFHGCLAYAVNWALSYAGTNENLNNFVSASCITFSAGLISRFTGRQAVGNAVAGLYCLLPGAYLVRSITNVAVSDNFFVDIIQKAVIIGMGSWTGTIICSPIVLGTTTGILHQQVSHADMSGHSKDGATHHKRVRSDMSATNSTLLFF